tara:strand:+ start:400 stop:552 length:153 start_codon:yes stop_codon:yes gene_type:complete
MKEVEINTIEDKRDAVYIGEVIRESLFEKGIELDAFSFTIKVFYEEENKQ